MNKCLKERKACDKRGEDEDVRIQSKKNITSKEIFNSLSLSFPFLLAGDSDFIKRLRSKTWNPSCLSFLDLLSAVSLRKACIGKMSSCIYHAGDGASGSLPFGTLDGRCFWLALE